MNIAREGTRDTISLVSRMLLVLVYLVFGWQKLTGYGATTAYFQQLGLPLPVMATGVAVMFELLFGVAVALGLFTRPLAVVLALYTLVTALIARQFWTMSGAEHFENEIGFFKNVSIAAGFLELYV